MWKTSESKGASGNATSSHLVQIKELKLGRHIFPNDRIKRVDRDILGLDFLGQFVFQIDFKSKKMCISENMPNKFSQKLRKLLTGHIVMSVELKNKSTEALYDTGADTTVIDFEFVKNNSDLFKWVRKENGTDIHGHVIESEIYSCNEFLIGSLKLQNVEMATFSFGNYMRDKMEGTPIILGNNVIAKAKWDISLKTESWMLEPYEN